MARLTVAERARRDRMEALRKVAAGVKGWAPAREVLTPVRSIPTIFPQFDLATRVGGCPLQRVITVHGPSSHGKMHSVDEPILTPMGWQEIGELSIGDMVIGRDGKPTAVTGVFPQGELDTVWVVLDDGRRSRVGMEHLWYTTTKKELDRGRYTRLPRPGRERVATGKDGVGSVKTTRQIAESLTAIHYLPSLTAPVEYAACDAPLIDPYMLGLLIGDGTLSPRTPGFSSTYPQLVESLRHGAAMLGDAVTGGPKEWRVKGMATSDAIRFYGLNTKSYFKHIPAPYLRGSVDVRRAILAGLMDTDGSPTNEGTAAEYSTVSERLASDVAELARSLGARVYSFETATPSDFGRAWRVLVSGIDCPFRLDEKVARWNERVRECRPRVVAVGVAERAECVCIAVAADDHLYLTRDFIVTHNTSFVHGLGLSFLNLSNFYALVDAEFTTPEDWLVKLMGEQMASHPGFVAKRPMNYEEVRADTRELMDTLGAAVKSGDLPEDTAALIAVDSIRKLVPKNIVDKIADNKDGIDGMKGRSAMIKAGHNAAWLDEMVPQLNVSNSTLVLIARESENVNKANRFDPDFKITGGVAVIFDASLVIRVERAGWVTINKTAKNPGGQVIGERHRFTITKSKIAGKDGKVTRGYFHTSNGVVSPEGFDMPRDLVEMGKNCGRFKVGGSWVTDLETGEKWNGTEKAVAAFHELTPDQLNVYRLELLAASTPEEVETEDQA